MTIKELAAELNVSEQALRQWCKKNNVRKERTKGTKATYILSFDVVESIKKHYSSAQSNESKESKATKEHNKSNESKESVAILDELRAQIAELRADKQFLQAQIAEKDKQIDKLTTALQAEQALHGIEKKQKVIEVRAPERPAPTQTAPTQTTQATHRKEKARPKQPQQKRGLLATFSQIFKK